MLLTYTEFELVEKWDLMGNQKNPNARRMGELLVNNLVGVAWFCTAFEFNCISLVLSCISKHSHLKWPVACVALLTANANSDRAIPGRPASLNRETYRVIFL